MSQSPETVEPIPNDTTETETGTNGNGDTAQSTSETGDDHALQPFYSINATGSTTVHIRAGWLNPQTGSVEHLELDATLPLRLAVDAQTLAIEWYADTINQLVETRAAIAEQDREEQPPGEAADTPDTPPEPTEDT